MCASNDNRKLKGVDASQAQRGVGVPAEHPDSGRETQTTTQTAPEQGADKHLCNVSVSMRKL